MKLTKKSGVRIAMTAAALVVSGAALMATAYADPIPGRLAIAKEIRDRRLGDDPHGEAGEQRADHGAEADAADADAPDEEAEHDGDEDRELGMRLQGLRDRKHGVA